MVATHPPPVMSSRAPGAHTTRTALAGIAVGLAVFGVIAAVGLGGYWMLGAKARRSEAPVPDVLPAGAAAAPSQAASSPAPQKPAPTTENATIQLEFVEPKAGVSLLLDGQPLKGEKPKISRPKPGSVKLLVVSADGYKQDTIRIDENTPDQLDLMLVRLAQARTEQRPSQPAATGSAKPKEPAKPLKVDIPDNPF